MNEMTENLESDEECTQSKKSSIRTVLRINKLQLQRLHKLIKRFQKREKKICYLNAMPIEEEDAVSLLKVIDAPEANTVRIVRPKAAKTDYENSTFSKLLRSVNPSQAVMEHNVLDLFVSACKKVPGFEAASAKKFRIKPPVIVAKAPAKPIAYTADDPPLKFDSPLFGCDEVKLGALCNALAVGSTGSGKTLSFIQPALSAMLSYRLADGKTASLLVIDPKIELLTSIKEKLIKLGELDRLVVLGSCAAISYFDQHTDLKLLDRFEKVKSFTPNAVGSADDSRWQVFAEQFIMAFLKDDQAFFNASGGLCLFESVVSLATGDTSYLRTNQWFALRKLLLMGLEGSESRQRLSDIYDVLTSAIGMVELERPLSRYLALRDGGDQYFFNARGALSIVENLGSEETAHLMDFGVRLGRAPKDRIDIAKLIDRGAVLVYQPQSSHSHGTVGRALKSIFFRSVMDRADMHRPVGYFCDEFQRFITIDELTGDHTFLDRCRAYRCTCFLATQSIAALRAAVPNKSSESCLDSILINTPSKLCFRTPDVFTIEVMKGIIPPDPRSNAHVLTCRPPGSLRTGECYYTLEENWGRVRYQPKGNLT